MKSYIWYWIWTYCLRLALICDLTAPPWPFSLSPLSQMWWVVWGPRRPCCRLWYSQCCRWASRPVWWRAWCRPSTFWPAATTPLSLSWSLTYFRRRRRTDRGALRAEVGTSRGDTQNSMLDQYNNLLQIFIICPFLTLSVVNDWKTNSEAVDCRCVMNVKVIMCSICIYLMCVCVLIRTRGEAGP